MTNFVNPNAFDFYKDSDEQFDTLYLTLKIALSLGKPLTGQALEEAESKKKNEENYLHPVIVCDGFVVMDVLHSFSDNIPSEVFYCATPLRSISKTILSDYLKVREISSSHCFTSEALVLLSHTYSFFNFVYQSTDFLDIIMFTLIKATFRSKYRYYVKLWFNRACLSCHTYRNKYCQ